MLQTEVAGNNSVSNSYHQASVFVQKGGYFENINISQFSYPTKSESSFQKWKCDKGGKRVGGGQLGRSSLILTPLPSVASVLRHGM